VKPTPDVETDIAFWQGFPQNRLADERVGWKAGDEDPKRPNILHSTTNRLRYAMFVSIDPL
jgi:hypothetical protein